MRGLHRPTRDFHVDPRRVDSGPLHTYQARPTAPATRHPGQLARPPRRTVATLLAIATLACWAPRTARPDEVHAQIRIVWGAGAGQPRPWRGSIAVDHGQLSNLQPLGINPDEPAALQLVENRLVLNPLLPRAFDGCDVAIVADSNAELLVHLSATEPGPIPNTQETTATTLHDGVAAPPNAPKLLRIPIRDILTQPYRAPLGATDGHLLVSRTPGDQLRVEITRDSLVFHPQETWQLRIIPDVAATPDELPLAIDLSLRHAGSGHQVWETTHAWRPGDDPLDIEVAAPADEGAYRLHIAARGRERLAHRWLLNPTTPVKANRSIELVVIDPSQAIATPIEAWTTEWTIDPASPRWWQRLPAWTRVSHLPGMPAPRSLGNVAPMTEPFGDATMAALPSTRPDAEPSWQAYTLPIRSPGWPHAVEIQLPPGQQQQLEFCLAEPDAAGRAINYLRHASAFTEGENAASPTNPHHPPVRRLVFWPRTQMPVLLVANRSTERPAYYGQIRLQAAAPPAHSAASAPTPAPQDRLVAAYLATPDLVRAFGAQGRYDPTNGLAITDWNMVLTAAQRIVNRLKSTGYNAAAICVAADGGSLSPAGLFGNSPRFDNGRLASDGADPMPKDVLEALCRIFDREGLRLIPVVQLATPLPVLESSLLGSNPTADGLLYVDGAGQTVRTRSPSAPPTRLAAGPHYNLLNAEVQQRLIDAALQFAERYQQHACLAGIGLQLSADGYGVLPEPAWGLDDNTFAQFAKTAGLEVDNGSPHRFAERRALVLGTAADAWQAWRQTQLTSFYRELASRLQQQDPRLRLVLSTEHALAGRRAETEIRKAVAGRGSFQRAWELAGLDPQSLATTPGILLLRPRTLGSSLAADHRLVDRHVHQAAAIDRLCEAPGNDGTLVYYASDALALPTFNQQSPFGSANTQMRASATSSPAGHDLRRGLVEAAAANDWAAFFEGGEAWLIADDPDRRRLLSTLAALPDPGRATQTDQVQPLTMRVYRDEQQTTVCFINEAPWPIRGHWVAATEGQVEMYELGDPPTPAAMLGGGPQSQTLELKAYDLRAWTIADPKARIEPAVLQSSLPAQNDLVRQLDLLDARMQNLAIRRPYPELVDPGFEGGDEQTADGWQTRRGAVGDIRYDAPAYAGDRSLRLVSADALGVAVQSRSFPVPKTGQLIVQAAVRNGTPEKTAQLHFSIEYERDGRVERQHRTFGADAPLDNAWTVRELAVDNLPLQPGAEARVQFHATGDGEVWIDEVALFDLAFSSDERIELAKRLYAARTSMNEGKLLDCVRHIDSYWTQRLIENVPVPQVALAPQPPKVAPTKQKADASRRWFPRLWR